MAFNNNRNYSNSDRSYGGGNGNNKNGSSNELFNQYVPITEDNYVDQAEKAINFVGKHVDKRGNPVILTTSKIRNILSLNAELYNDIINEPNEQLSMDFKGRINYLKVRIIYEAGREESVKYFIDESFLLKVVDSIKGSRSQYMLFSRYLEALVAYRKFKYGKDE